MAQEQDKRTETDSLETVTPARPPAGPAERRGPFPPDAASSESDAGIADTLLEEDGTDTGDDLEDNLEDDLNGHDRDFSDDAPPTEIREIPMTDLDQGVDQLEPPEMADLNVPGEVDIEELDDDALDGTDLPADARLDPIEE